MGVVKAKPKAKSSKSSIGSKISSIASKFGTSKSKGGRRTRRHGPEYYARQLLVLKLKRKIQKVKFGGR